MRLIATALAIASFIGTATPVHADTITWSVSIVGSGSLGTQTFTDKRITLIDATTTENYYEFGDFGGPVGFAFCCADSATATIEGIGTFGSAAVEVDTEFSTSGLAIGDSENRLSIASGLDAPNTPETIGPVIGNGAVVDACDPSFQFAPCPGYIWTSAGQLFINSYDTTSATGEEILTATPEPSTFALLGTGMIGVAGFVRRKFSRA
jgi:hypothetical protein